jgi:hypothetical protein
MGPGRTASEEGETPREDEAHEGRGLGVGLNNRPRGTDARGEQSPVVELIVRSAILGRHCGFESLPGARERCGGWDGGRTIGQPQEGNGLREEVRLRVRRSALKGATPRAGPA